MMGPFKLIQFQYMKKENKSACLSERTWFLVFHNHIHINRDIEIETFTANLYLGPSFFVPDE